MSDIPELTDEEWATPDPAPNLRAKATRAPDEYAAQHPDTTVAEGDEREAFTGVVRLSVNLAPSVAECLHDLAEEDGVSLTEAIRMSIIAHRDAHAAPRPAATVVEGDETAVLRAEVERLRMSCGVIAHAAELPVRRAEIAVLRAQRDEARAALARVEALVSPQWRTIPSDLPDSPGEAFSVGRNWIVDRIRAALNGARP